MKPVTCRRYLEILVLSISLIVSSKTVTVMASSLSSVTDEAEIRPIRDGSGKYLMKSDGFYCLNENGAADASPAVHYFDHMEIDGTVLNGFYYHGADGRFSAASAHIEKLSKLTCLAGSGEANSGSSTDSAGAEKNTADTQEESEEITFDGYYMVNSLGKLTAAPQVRYISQLTLNGVTYDGYYYFNEYGRMITEGGTYELHMTSNGQEFDGTYYFGGTNGVLVQEAGTTPDGFPVDDTGKVLGTEDLGMDTLKPQLISMLSGYDGQWSVYVKDLDTDEEIVLNNTPLYSASLIKAFVMAKTYEDMDEILANEAKRMNTAADNKAVQVKVDDLLWNMITVSDNESCNELGRLQTDTYDFLKGAEEVNAYIAEEGYEDTTFQSTLHPSGSPVLSLGGHNTTTVKDCGLLLERIYRGECVSEEASAQMLELLLNQENTMKIPAGISADVQIANKTGETDEDQHDIAIVYGPKTTYILCVMSQDFKSSDTAIKNIRSISGIVYNYLNL